MASLPQFPRDFVKDFSAVLTIPELTCDYSMTAEMTSEEGVCITEIQHVYGDSFEYVTYPTYTRFVSTCTKSYHQVIGKLQRIVDPTWTVDQRNNAARISYKFYVYVGKHVPISSTIEMAVVAKCGDEVISKAGTTATVDESLSVEKPPEPKFAVEKSIAFSEPNSIISQDIDLTLVKSDCGHYDVHVLYPPRDEKPTFVIERLMVMGTKAFFTAPFDRFAAKYFSVTNNTEMNNYAYLPLGYICPKSDSAHLYMKVLAKPVEPMSKNSYEPVIFALVYNNSNSVVVGQVNLDRLSNAYWMPPTHQLESRWSRPQVNHGFVDFAATQVIRVYFYVEPSSSMRIVHVQVETSFEPAMRVLKLDLSEVGKSLYTNWKGTLVQTSEKVEDGFRKFIFKTPGGNEIRIGNFDRDSNTGDSVGPQAWLIAFDIHIALASNETDVVTEAGTLKLSLTYQRSDREQSTTFIAYGGNNIRFRNISDYRKTIWMPKPFAEYFLTLGPQNQAPKTVLGVPVFFKLHIRLIGARRYLVRLIYPPSLLVYGARLSRLGGYIPEIRGHMNVEDGPWNDKCRSTTINLGLIISIIHNRTPRRSPNRNNITLDVDVGFDTGLKKVPKNAKIQFLVYANDRLEYETERVIEEGEISDVLKIKPDDMGYNLTTKNKTVRPGGVVIVHTSLYYPPSSLADTTIQLSIDHRVFGCEIIRVGRNIARRDRMKRQVEQRYAVSNDSSHLELGLVHNSGIFSDSSAANITTHEDNEISLMCMIQISEEAEIGKLSVWLIATVNSEVKPLTTANLWISNEETSKVQLQTDPVDDGSTVTHPLSTSIQHKLRMWFPLFGTWRVQVTLATSNCGALTNLSYQFGGNVYATKRTSIGDPDAVMQNRLFDFGYVTNTGRITADGQPWNPNDTLEIQCNRVLKCVPPNNKTVDFELEVYVDDKLKENFAYESIVVDDESEPGVEVDIKQIDANTGVLPGDPLFFKVSVRHLKAFATIASEVRVFIYSANHLGNCSVIEQGKHGVNINLTTYGVLIQYNFDFKEWASDVSTFRALFDPEHVSPRKRMDKLWIPFNVVYRGLWKSTTSSMKYITIQHTTNPHCAGKSQLQYSSTHRIKESCRVTSSLGKNETLWRAEQSYFSFKPPNRGMPFTNQEFIQIDLTRACTVLEAHTRASYLENYVTSFKLGCSQDGKVFDMLRNPQTGVVQVWTFPAKTKSCSERLTVVLLGDLPVCRFVRFIPASGSFGTLHNVTINVDFTVCDHDRQSSDCLEDQSADEAHEKYYERGYIYLKNYKRLVVCGLPSVGKIPHCALTEGNGIDWFPLDSAVTNVILDDPESGATYGLLNDQRSVLVSRDGGYTWKYTGDDLPSRTSTMTRALVFPWSDFSEQTPETLYSRYGIQDENGTKLFSVCGNGVYVYKYEWRRILAWGTPDIN